MNEDWDDMAFAEPLAGEELERLLARYSRVRLEPSAAQAKRARSALMEAAWRRRIEANRVVAVAPARHVPFSGWNARRLGASLAAAVFAGLMLGTSVFAASRAGGPLYEPRLALQELGLPSDPGARTDAQVKAAKDRLIEALQASTQQDGDGAAAALHAYNRTLADIAFTAEGSAADLAAAALKEHHVLLEQMADGVPPDGVEGVKQALANNEHLRQQLLTAGAGAKPSSSSNGNAGNDNGNGAGNGNGNANGAGNGNGHGPGGVADPDHQPGVGIGPDGLPSVIPVDRATPSPAAQPTGGTDDPEATPRPTKSPKPDKTDKPGKTPKPRPSHAGGPGGNTGNGQNRTPSPQRGPGN